MKKRKMSSLKLLKLKTAFQNWSQNNNASSTKDRSLTTGLQRPMKTMKLFNHFLIINLKMNFSIHFGLLQKGTNYSLSIHIWIRVLIICFLSKLRPNSNYMISMDRIWYA